MVKIKPTISDRDGLVKAKSIEEIEDILKNTKFSISFSYFEFSSICSNGFNNFYRSDSHFLKTNSDLFCALKDLSNETYNSAIITGKLKTNRHFKKIEREASINRINDILVNCYHKSENAIDQWKESVYVECGLSIGSRVIGILINYSRIELLFIDPNHLVFPSDKFPTKIKMQYEFNALYNLTSDIQLSEFVKKEAVVVNCDKEEERERLKLYEEAIKEFKNGNFGASEFASYCELIYKEYKEEDTTLV